MKTLFFGSGYPRFSTMTVGELCRALREHANDDTAVCVAWENSLHSVAIEGTEMVGQELCLILNADH
jgi:hypothetical protein